jgi:hypothetical protein
MHSSTDDNIFEYIYSSLQSCQKNCGITRVFFISFFAPSFWPGSCSNPRSATEHASKISHKKPCMCMNSVGFTLVIFDLQVVPGCYHKQCQMLSRNNSKQE